MPHIERDPYVRHVAMPPAEPHPAGAEGPGPFLEGGDIIVVGRDVLCGATDLTSNEAGAAPGCAATSRRTATGCTRSTCRAPGCTSSG